MKSSRIAVNAVAALVFLLLGAPALHAQAPAQPVVARHGMVVAQEARAARVGVDILKAGGNAVDAAVATGFALAVIYPRAGNIGGGGFMLIHLADGKRDIVIDYRETAPAATTRDIFLNAQGEADARKSRESGLAVGVPGTVAGLTLAHARYGSGKLTLAQLIAPAIRLAREGITIDGDVADTLEGAQSLFARWPSSAGIFLKADGTVLAPRRHACSNRPRGVAGGDRAGWRAGFLSRADRRKDRRFGARRRRDHDARRFAELSRGRARGVTRAVSRP